MTPTSAVPSQCRHSISTWNSLVEMGDSLQLHPVSLGVEEQWEFKCQIRRSIIQELPR
jgi:hypothetical protein